MLWMWSINTKENKQMDIAAARNLIRRLADIETPEEKFEMAIDMDGVMTVDGVTYHDADEMVADMSDAELCDAFAEFMNLVREAKEIVKFRR